MALNCWRLLLWAGLVCTSVFASAASVHEYTFKEKFAASDLVVIATVTSIEPESRKDVGSIATLSVVQTLKGSEHRTIEVLTYSDVAELDPNCCFQGATYLMFLSKAPDGLLTSSWGTYGMVRVGGPMSLWTAAELSNCDTRPEYGSLIFSGAPEALKTLELLAMKEGAPFGRCNTGTTQALIFSTIDDAAMARANKMLRALSQGELPNLEAGMMGRD